MVSPCWILLDWCFLHPWSRVQYGLTLGSRGLGLLASSTLCRLVSWNDVSLLGCPGLCPGEELAGPPFGIHTPIPCSHTQIPRSALCFLVNQMFIVRSQSPGWGWPAAKQASSRPLGAVWVPACWSLQRE